jgi:hypothetical protein
MLNPIPFDVKPESIELQRNCSKSSELEIPATNLAACIFIVCRKQQAAAFFEDRCHAEFKLFAARASHPKVVARAAIYSCAAAEAM